MTNADLLWMISKLFENAEGNRISPEIALRKDLIGLEMYESPLIGFSSAEDPMYDLFLKPDAVGPWFVKPSGWLDGAKTVVSLFFPFSDRVRTSNRYGNEFPSAEWLHGRVEGQFFINSFMEKLKQELEICGVHACVPSSDNRFFSITGEKAAKGFEASSLGHFSSNWSERHAAFASGLGTFGLSKCLITEKGCAGRFASIIIDIELNPTQRPYSGIYEYCLKCGKCAERCPISAISIQEGKNLKKCFQQMHMLQEKFAPRYGCGLCYVSVPCEDRIPAETGE